MKNVACSRLGMMLHLVIQKEEEPMKTSEFQKDIGGTAACMRRLSVNTKGCGHLTSNYTQFSDSWFSSIKLSEEAMDAGVEYCGRVEIIHKNDFVQLC